MTQPTSFPIAKHLLSFSFPVLSVVFSLTGPHLWWEALGYLLFIVFALHVDNRAHPALHPPHEDAAGWPYDLMLYAGFAFQLVNVVLMARLASRSGLFSVDALVCVLFVGTNSGFSAIVIAHELIHRQERHMRGMARIIMATVFYEHFCTEHVRGHHLRVGTFEDGATARFGESWGAFWRRTVPAQFKSAWRLESKRLGDENMRLMDRRVLRNDVLHGVLLEVAITAGILVAFGWEAAVVFLLAARNAVVLLEAVNYFEHWGIARTGRKVKPEDSWDSTSWFTYYSLVGLSRHADHHAHAARPFHLLHAMDESPKTPAGYFGMVIMGMFNNPRFQREMTAELQRRGLGPFATERPDASA